MKILGTINLGDKMKILTSLLVITFSVQAQSADQKIIDSKDWSAMKVASHKVSAKEACVASTFEKDRDSSLEVYMEASDDGGFVKPMVQIVTTEIPAALGAVASVDGRKMPMTISLKETKEVEVEVLEEGSSIPVIQKVEQQVFVGKFQDKESMIRLLRAKNRVRTKFFAASGEVGEATFSLRGSSKVIKTLLTTCSK